MGHTSCGEPAFCCPVCLLNEEVSAAWAWMQEPWSQSLSPSLVCPWHESGGFLLSPALTSMGKIVSAAQSHVSYPAHWRQGSQPQQKVRSPGRGNKGVNSKGMNAAHSFRFLPTSYCVLVWKLISRCARRPSLFSSGIHLLFLKLLPHKSVEFNLGCFCVASSKPFRLVRACRSEVWFSNPVYCPFGFCMEANISCCEVTVQAIQDRFFVWFIVLFLFL